MSPYYRIRFGPVRDLRVVESFTALLGRSYGVVGQIVAEPVAFEYHVLSSPVRSRSAAEARARLLAALQIRSVVVRSAAAYRLHFGAFPSVAQAQKVARQVRRRGFGAVVEPKRVLGYTVIVRRVPQSAAMAVVRRLRAEGFSVRLAREMP